MGTQEVGPSNLVGLYSAAGDCHKCQEVVSEELGKGHAPCPEAPNHDNVGTRVTIESNSEEKCRLSWPERWRGMA